MRHLHDKLSARNSAVLAFIRDGGSEQMNFTAYGSDRPELRKFTTSIIDPSAPLKDTALDSYPWSLWTMFEEFITSRRFTALSRYKKLWRKLLSPAQIDQLDTYLPRNPRTLFQRDDRPCYLHGDLNEDHLLIVPEEASQDPATPAWKPLKVIDFGDALIGDRHYDFVAIHISLFRCNKELLRAFLDAYTETDGDKTSPILWPQKPDRFAYVCMNYTLLHRQDALRTALRHMPSLKETTSLLEVEKQLWQLKPTGT